MSFRILLARERGMCAGVERAILVVEKALERYGANKVWVLHEVVHNRHVVEDLRRAGAIFVNSIAEVPEGSVLIFSAHGVSIAVEQEALRRNLTVIDATCPVVSGIHRKMNRAGKAGLEAVVIGHEGHQEVIGTIGQYEGDPKKVHVILTPEDVKALAINGEKAFFATQTTLSVEETKETVEALRCKYPSIQGPKQDDTCNATQLRQNAVRDLAHLSDAVIIAGSQNSSNSNRLREEAEHEGTQAYLIDDASGIDLKWLEGVKTVGVSAGASAPDYVIKDIVDHLLRHGGDSVEEVGEAGRTRHFPLPRPLQS